MKKIYQTPKIITIGKMKKLTKGNHSAGLDQDGTQTKWQIHVK